MKKVKSIVSMLSELVEMENGELYVRNASNDWEVCYGDLPEGLSPSDCKIIEESYQRFKTITNGEKK